MLNKELRIVFFGTAEIAAIELEHLVQNGYNVVAVVTNIDKPAGRGKILTPSEVKKMAIQLDIPILQPTSMKNNEFIEQLKSFHADLQIVVAFRMMPKEVYSMPKYGTFNLHTSLLPQYRGAAPINWAIINGEQLTGITTFLLNDKIDCGEILLQEPITISDSMTYQELYDIMAQKGKKLITDTIDLIAKGNYQTIKQDMSVFSKPAPKIFKADTYINWNNSCEKIINFIRGLSPIPCAKAVFCDFQQKKEFEFKIFEAKIFDKSHNQTVGDLWIYQKKFLLVQCTDGTLQITDLQLNGKKRMPAIEFLKGFRIDSVLQNK